jgi:hypothetical protein
MGESSSGPGGTGEGRTGDRFGGQGRGGPAFDGGFGASTRGNRDGGESRVGRGDSRFDVFAWIAAGRPGTFADWLLGRRVGNRGIKGPKSNARQVSSAPTASPFQYSLLGDPANANTTNQSLLG